MMDFCFRIFLCEHGGNPNKKNSQNETSLHCVCILPPTQQNMLSEQRRADCLLLILQWTGAELESGELEKVDLGATDEVGRLIGLSSATATWRLTSDSILFSS